MQAGRKSCDNLESLCMSQSMNANLPSLPRAAKSVGDIFSMTLPTFPSRTDTLGCNRNKELILARADERSRKQLHATDCRISHYLALKEAQMKGYEDKHNREEMRTVLKDSATRRRQWKKILTTVSFPAMLLANNDVCVEKERILRAGRSIVEFIIQQRDRRIQQEIKLSEEKRLLDFGAAHSTINRIAVIWRRRVAATRVKIFLTACATFPFRKFSASYVLKYMRAVKFLQGKIRQYLSHQNDHFFLINKLWDVIEHRYISHMIRCTINFVVDKHAANENREIIPDKYTEKFTFESRLDRKWLDIESKFSSYQNQTYRGKTKDYVMKMRRKDKDCVSSFVLSKAIRRPYLRKILRSAVR